MCVGTEFGIIDAVAGVFFAFVTYGMHAVGFPVWPLFAISTIGWFGMSAYFFYKGAKCNCQELEAQFKKSMAETDAIFERLKK